MRTFGDQLQRYRGLGPGFDFLRIGLASLIVVIHSYWLAGSTGIRGTHLWFLEYALVPMFFALSGFLISGSASRLSLGNFLINRGLRIIPALGVDVFFCALIVGPIFTTVSLAHYFSSPDFFRYFLNVTGWIHYALPGVFLHNPSTQVNMGLWTVPYEMLCYALISALILAGGMKRPALTALATLAFMLIGVLTEWFAPSLPALAFDIGHFFFVSRGGQTITTFLLGILTYQLRDHIPYSRALMLLCVAICVAGALLMHSGDIERVANRFVMLPALVYLTMWIGLTPVPVPALFRSGDYSYGVYLYHGPVLQILVTLLPGVMLVPPYGPLALVALGLPCVALFAAFSWHFVEKPILGLRKKFSFVAKVRGVAAAQEATIAATPVKGTEHDFAGARSAT